MARPLIEIDKEQFEKLCGYMCTQSEIADFFHVSIATTMRWCKRTYGMSFDDIYKKLSSIGKTSLRRFQFKLAETNATMAIFLGKQYLGQTDKPEQKDDAEVTEVDVTWENASGSDDETPS